MLNKFIEYSLQDSKALFNALDRAQTIYSTTHSVDITSILSTSTLSLKIFRQNFLDVEIPILKRSVDSFVRKGYFGGATDYYRAHGKNLHYYDVNSLYPFAMLNPMPLEMINHYKDMSNVNFDSFFGFCLCKIKTPKDIAIPLLPYKVGYKTTFPKGEWTGVYFSEELKEVMKHGYQITPLQGYEFSKTTLFNNYIQHFYNIKKVSNGPERFIAKMHLNQLYGIFGRKQDLIQTKLIKNSELRNYLIKYIVKSRIEINDDLSLILFHNNLNIATVKRLNVEFDSEFANYATSVKSNVAIAAAVTAYARTHMVRLKTDCAASNINVYYSDTDSIFTDKTLPDNLVGVELGLLKDELDGLVINEAYFLGIKQYGYWYQDSQARIFEKSVFAGVKRDSIAFKDVAHIFKGGSVVVSNPARFYKSFKNLDITIKDSIVTVQIEGAKPLVNNVYQPLTVKNLGNLDLHLGLFFRLKSLILRNLKLVRKFFNYD